MKFTLRQLLAGVAVLAILLGVFKLLANAAMAYDSRAARNEVWSVAYSPDGKTLGVFALNGRESGFSDSRTCDAYYSMVLFDSGTLSKKRLIQREFHKGPEPMFSFEWTPPRSIGFAADSKSLYAMNWKTSELDRWDIDGARWANERFPDGLRPDGFTVSPRGDQLAILSPSSGVEIYDAATGRQRFSHAWSRLISFSHDAKRMAMNTPKGVEIWDLDTQILLATFTESPEALKKEQARRSYPVTSTVSCLTFSPDGETVTIGSIEGLRMWSVGTGKHQAISPEHFKVHLPDGRTPIIADYGTSTRGLVYSPDGTYLAVFGGYGLRIFDATKSYALVRSVPQNSTRCLTFAPDGKTYATGGVDGKLATWDVATGNQLQSVTIGP